MAFVTLRDGESPEGIVSRFRAAVTRNGILKEHKDRRFFRSKGEGSPGCSTIRPAPPPLRGVAHTFPAF